MGALHARIIASDVPQADLIAVTDLDKTLATDVAEAAGTNRADTEEMLADPAVTAVVVATPPRTHCALIEQAARAGKHILCEKPLGWTLEEIDAALAAVSEFGVKLQVGFNRRFDPSFARAREMIVAGEIGEPLTAFIVGRDPIEFRPVGREDGDLFLDTTIHDLDMARFLVGSEPTSVFVQGGVMATEPLDDPDTAMTTLRFENGTIASIDNTRLSGHGYDQRVEVVGTKGMVSVENVPPHTATLARGDAVSAPGPEPFFYERYLESYRRELHSFVDCIALGSAPAITGADGRAAVALAWACVKSYREGRPVSVSEVESA